jgi:hypothetical protein
LTAYTPSYVFGAKVALPFMKNVVAKKSAQEIWKMSAMDNGEDQELEDEDNLLDEEDVKKPLKQVG